LEKAARAKRIDLEAMETALRAVVLAAGAKALAGLLDGVGRGRREEAVRCSCGTTMESRGVEEKTLLTILGEVPFDRSCFKCPQCGKLRYPGDEELDVVDTTRSPGVRRMMARAGSKSTFKEGRDDLRVYAGITVSAKDVERVAERTGEEVEHWAARERQEILREPAPPVPAEPIPVLYVSYDGTGIPMIPAALQGRKGKQPDGSAKTREVKLGCIFTQTITDERGFPVRDPDSTTFVGAIETAEEFGWRIYAEAVRRGLHRAQKVVILGDAARWIHGLAAEHFPGAIEIVDLYHAREHLAALCKLLCGTDDRQLAHMRIRWWTDLDAGRVEKIVAEAQARLPQEKQQAKLAQNETHYLTENKERMRYADFRAQGLFVGSGVVEAGCKTVIGQRLKQSGMEWSVRGANAIIALRCCHLSGRFEDFWESRCA
jgi:hypothetical protein